MLAFDNLHTGGHWTTLATGETLTVRSPHHQTAVGTAPHVAPADVDRAVAAARTAFDEGPWPRKSPEPG